MFKEEKCKLRKAVWEDWKDLLNWRNDIDTRENSINSEIIAEEGHKNWYKMALQNPDIAIYIYECENEKIGTVRAKYEGAKCELSWTLNPTFRGQGMAKNMVLSILPYIHVPIIEAIVLPKNKASQKIAEHIGLQFQFEKLGVLYYSNQVSE
jgi:RimJ/RimL family protein N-acetyltransferase